MAQKFIGVILPIRLGQTGMFDQSTTVIEQVRSNFKNLILTKKGERVGQPELGCDLWKVLFEPMNDNILENAKQKVEEAVTRWLPFLELRDFQITKSDVSNSLNITCLYRFKKNPNLVDQVTVSTNMLGINPSTGRPNVPLNPNGTEPTTPSGISSYAAQVADMRRIRRAEMTRASD